MRATDARARSARSSVARVRASSARGRAPAFAHAVLEGTDPGSGATVQRSPQDITLTFSETGRGVARCGPRVRLPRRQARRREPEPPGRRRQQGAGLRSQARRRHVRRHVAGDLRRRAPDSRCVHLHRRHVGHDGEGGAEPRATAAHRRGRRARSSGCCSRSRGSARSLGLDRPDRCRRVPRLRVAHRAGRPPGAPDRLDRLGRRRSASRLLGFALQGPYAGALDAIEGARPERLVRGVGHALRSRLPRAGPAAARRAPVDRHAAAAAADR